MRTRSRGRALAGFVLALAAGAPLVAQEPLPDLEPSWLDRLTVYGDFRFRSEFDFDLPGQRDRFRTRIRARLGAVFALDPDFLLGARVVTGDPDDPNSPHQTLGQVFDNFELSLDRIYLTWHPGGSDTFEFTAGKFQNPFHFDPVFGEMVWDNDVQPEGAAGAVRLREIGPFDRVDLIAMVIAVLEQAQADDSWAGAAQIWASMPLGSAMSTELVFTTYAWGNTEPGGSRVILADNAGNAVLDRNGDGLADAFTSRFLTLGPRLVLRGELLDAPLAFAVQYYRNVRSVPAGQDAQSIGVALGEARQAGDWRFSYHYQLVERDSVFSPTAQDGFLLQTNLSGHIAGLRYQFTDSVGLHLWVLATAPDQLLPGSLAGGTGGYRWRLRLDLEAKF